MVNQYTNKLLNRGLFRFLSLGRIEPAENWLFTKLEYGKHSPHKKAGSSF